MEHKTTLEIAALVFNFAIIILATVLIVFYDWSLWTYLGFAFFMVSTSNSKSD